MHGKLRSGRTMSQPKIPTRRLNKIRKMTAADWGLFRGKGAADCARTINETLCQSVENGKSLKQAWDAILEVLDSYEGIGSRDPMVRDIVYVQVLYVYEPINETAKKLLSELNAVEL